MDNELKTNLAGCVSVSSSCDASQLVSGTFCGQMTEQFRIVFELIRKGALTCEEAWKLLLDVVPRKTEYVPYAAPAYPVCPVYRHEPGTGDSTPYSPDYFKIWCMSSSRPDGVTGGEGGQV